MQDRVEALTAQISEWNQRVIGLEKRLAEEIERRVRAEHRDRGPVQNSVYAP